MLRSVPTAKRSFVSERPAGFRRLSRALVLAVTPFFLPAFPASATTVLDVSVEEMASTTPLIVRGVVTDRSVGWSDDGLRIETRTRIRVTGPLKGPVLPEVVVRQSGGELDGVGMFIPGDASFTVGEEVVVFLEPHPGILNEWVLVAMAAAKFTVQPSDDGPILLRDTSGLSFARPGDDGVIRPSHTQPSSALPLSELVRTLERAGSK